MASQTSFVKPPTAKSQTSIVHDGNRDQKTTASSVSLESIITINDSVRNLPTAKQQRRWTLSKYFGREGFDIGTCFQQYWLLILAFVIISVGVLLAGLLTFQANSSVITSLSLQFESTVAHHGTAISIDAIVNAQTVLTVIGNQFARTGNDTFEALYNSIAALSIDLSVSTSIVGLFLSLETGETYWVVPQGFFPDVTPSNPYPYLAGSCSTPFALNATRGFSCMATVSFVASNLTLIPGPAQPIALLDPRWLPNYQATLASAPGSVLYTNTVMSSVPSGFLMSPLFVGGKPVGVIGSVYSLQLVAGTHFKDLLSEFTPHPLSTIYGIEPNGNIVANSKDSCALIRNPNISATNVGTFLNKKAVDCADHVIRQTSVAVLTHLPDVAGPPDPFSFGTSVDGRPFSCTMVFTSFTVSPVIIAICVPRSVFFGEVDSTRNTISWVLPLIFVLILVIGGMIVIKMTRTYQHEIRVRRSMELLNVDYKQAKEVAESSSAMKGAFLANMSHEIRTPLTGILGMVEMMIDDSNNLTDEQKEKLKLIESCGTGLMHVLNDILDLSKVEAGMLLLESNQFNLCTELQSVMDMFAAVAERKNIELLLEMDPRVKDVWYGDVTRIRQIAMNLINNAVKFTASGFVKLLVHPLTEATWDTRITQDSKEQGFILRVQDSGCGIPNLSLQSVFESFVQADLSTSRRYGGSGLGLTIVRHLVGLMHGSMNVTSTVGVGTTFSMLLLMQDPRNCLTDLDADTLSIGRNTMKTTWSDVFRSNGWTSALIATGYAIADAQLLLELNALPGVSADVADCRETVAGFMFTKAYDLVLLNIAYGVHGSISEEPSERRISLKMKRQSQCTPMLSTPEPALPSELVVDLNRGMFRDAKMLVWISGTAISPMKQALVLASSQFDLLIKYPIYSQKVMSLVARERQTHQSYQVLPAPPPVAVSQDVSILVDDMSNSQLPLIPKAAPDQVIALTAGPDLASSASVLGVDQPDLTVSALSAGATPIKKAKKLKSSDGTATATYDWPPNARLLLVEDQVVNQKVISACINRLFHPVVDIANNGEEAVNLCMVQQYDLILMDCQMPVMDGYDATRNIRVTGLNQHTPIVALTAHAMSGDRNMCIDAGMDDYLTKPIEREKFAKTLHHHMVARRIQPNFESMV